MYVSLPDNLHREPDSLVAYADAFVGAARNKLQPYIASINDKVDDEFLLELFLNYL